MAAAGSAEKLKVFVSYSRRDSSDFANELVAGLELVGFAPFLDQHDIAAGEDWEDRLGGLIRQADTMVFVISPEAVKSERCAWEVNTALTESKRVLPVIAKAVPESEIPEQLRRRQFIRFDAGPGLARPLSQLTDALRQNLDWVREHTRIGELAGRWEARGRPESVLLRGDDLAAAQTWLEQRATEAPIITDLMRAFIAASKESELRHLAKSNAAQRRIIQMQALASVLLIAIIAALIGWMNQDYLKQEWRWYTITQPYMRAQIRPYVLSAVAERDLKPGAPFKECAADCPEMIVISAGSFMMGSPGGTGRDDEYPQHLTTIAGPLAIAKFEVTFDEWDACVSYCACDPHINDSGFGRGQQPVINVTWSDAQRYVTWLAEMTGKPYRLLTEAEYEYAMRAGTQTAYPWGDDIGKNNADCKQCGSKWDNKQPAPVGSFASNSFGLYDMAGNVWEWTGDCYHTSYDGAPTDGSAWVTPEGCNDRVVRGGSWDREAETLRSANRGSRGNTAARFNNRGFRVARTLTP
jgi:formylglycine-generating enzyme required for sulfatase activity